LRQDYDSRYFWWELMEAWKKLFLVGFMVVIMPGDYTPSIPSSLPTASSLPASSPPRLMLSPKT